MRIHSAVLAGIRRNSEAFLTDTCTITQDVATSGTYGEKTHAAAPVATVKCRLFQAGLANTDATDMLASRELMTDGYRIAVPYDTPLDIDYRIEVNEVTYTVVRLETDWTDKAFKTAVLMRKRG